MSADSVRHSLPRAAKLSYAPMPGFPTTCMFGQQQQTAAGDIGCDQDKAIVVGETSPGVAWPDFGGAASARRPQQPQSQQRSVRKMGGKSAYKHVPHRDKPPHLVARRNARERRRVQAVNTAFARLRKCVPLENRNKRLSKVKTLHKAIEYIDQLQQLLTEADAQIQPSSTHLSHHDINKENSEHSHWIAIDVGCPEEEFVPYYDSFTQYHN